MGSRLTVGPPKINGGQGFSVRHCEYLDDVVGATAWALSSDQIYDLNPGLTESFPWLGTIAAGFEQYRWKRLRFLYKARTATNQSGTVYFATQLDSQDPPFGSKQEMMAYGGAQTTNLWLDLSHDCLMRRGDYMKKYFIRTGPLVSGQDRKSVV